MLTPDVAQSFCWPTPKNLSPAKVLLVILDFSLRLLNMVMLELRLLIASVVICCVFCCVKTALDTKIALERFERRSTVICRENTHILHAALTVLQRKRVARVCTYGMAAARETQEGETDTQAIPRRCCLCRKMEEAGETARTKREPNLHVSHCVAVRRQA